MTRESEGEFEKRKLSLKKLNSETGYFVQIKENVLNSYTIKIYWRNGSVIDNGSD